MKDKTKEIAVNDIDCEEAIRRLMDYLDNYLNDHRQSELEKHLVSCGSCMDRYEFQKKLKEKIAGLNDQCDPSLAETLKKLIDSL